MGGGTYIEVGLLRCPQSGHDVACITLSFAEESEQLNIAGSIVPKSEVSASVRVTKDGYHPWVIEGAENAIDIGN